MSIQSIKSEICQLLNIESISASEAKQLSQASNITTNWSKTETWQQLLDNIKQSQSVLESSVTDVAVDNVESTITEVESIVEASNPQLTIEPNYKSVNFIDFVLSNKLWFYKSYQVTDIKFPALNKAVLYSELLQDSFVITKSNNYSIAFKSVNQVLENVQELFTFDWLKLSNYYFDLREQELASEKELETGKIVYKSIKLSNKVNKGNQLILNVANFKKQSSGEFSSKSIKTFKDWLRVMYLEFPESKLPLFLSGLTRNYSRQTISEVEDNFVKSDKLTGKILNNNARTGSMAFYNEQHTDIKGRKQDKKAVYLTRNEERYTPVTDVYVQIKVAELFKLLDIEVDMSRYVASFCGYWKLVVISHILSRTQFNLANSWMLLVSSGLKINADVFGSYVLVEEIDSKRFNNKIRLTNDTTFKLPEDSNGKVASEYMEANTIKVIERVEVKHSNMLGSFGRPKSVKNTNKGAKNANYLKLAETRNYELRLFYLESGSKEKPHHSFQEVLANIVYVEKQTTISNEIGQIWIKQTRTNSNVLTLHCPKSKRFISGLMMEDLERKILTNKKHIERLSERIRQLRKEREENKVKKFDLVNERVITDEQGLGISVVENDENAKELKGLIEEKVRYENEVIAYDLQLPHEIILCLTELGIILTSNGRIEPKNLDWQKVFTTLELEIPILKNNPIVVKGAKHEQKTIL